MKTNLLLSNMTDAEERLFSQMKKNKDIQLLASNVVESCAIVDNTSLNPFNLFIGFVNGEEKICKGRYSPQNFSFPSNQDSQVTRVWLDCQKTKDIKFHVHSNGSYHVFNKDDERNNNLLIVFLECPDFVQLSLYDGRLVSQKVSHLFSSMDQTKVKIRTIAYSMLTQHFLGLPEYFLQLEGKAYGEK